jgi:hypothetical protein
LTRGRLVAGGITALEYAAYWLEPELRDAEEREEETMRAFFAVGSFSEPQASCR